jgi:hypothetical protein
MPTFIFELNVTVITLHLQNNFSLLKGIITKQHNFLFMTSKITFGTVFYCPVMGQEIHEEEQNVLYYWSFQCLWPNGSVFETQSAFTSY